MAISLDQFTKRLTDSGLITAADVAAFVSALPADRQTDTEALARELVRQRRLTAFQVQEIHQGRGRALTLGNYTVLDKLGQGGMGMVLKAEHRRMERLVALKVLSPKFTESPEAVARFQREVKAAAKLNHQHIVTAYDADEAGGTHFLVMEYVEGTDLSALVKKNGPLAVDKALLCVTQAARGLEYAHGRGVVHRDIKPANLLLDRDGAVKILDMGLARLDSAGEHQDELTGTGQIMGTIDYMAPEQALSTKSADRRADIYSLGITLWYLLTGRPAYTGDTAMAKLLAHRERTIPSIRDACPGVPPALDAVFARMVAKTPEARYQTMTECVADLERCRSGQQVTAPSVASAAGEDSRLSEFLRGLEQSAAGRGVTGKPLPKAAIAPSAVAPRLLSPKVVEETLANTLPAGDTDPTTQHSLGVDTAALGSAPLPGSLQSKLPFAPTRRNLALAGGAAALLVALAAGLWYSNRGTVRVADNNLLAPASGRVPGDGSTTSQANQPSGNTASGEYQWPAGTPAPAIAPFDAAQAKKHQEEWADHLGVPVEYMNSIGMKFRLIPPGEFMMGSTPEEIEAALVVAGDDENWIRYIQSEAPRHKVILTRPVYFGVHEVTQAQYELVCGQNPSHFGATGLGKDVITGMDTTSHPVEMVSWNDAVEFCDKLSEKEHFKPFRIELRAGEAVTTEGAGYRLPTEAEWEFACRAGTTTKYWIGNQDESLVEAGWFNSNSVGRTHRVEELKANPFGLFDIHGNVWEWVQDWWEPNYYAQHQGKPALDPSGPISAGSQRVIRGGLWLYHLSYCRASARNATGPERRDRTFGFRVALTVDAVRAAQSNQPPSAIAPFDAAQAKQHQQEWAAHLGVPIEYTNSIGMKFQLVPPGEFLMGVRDSDVAKLSEAVDAAVPVLGEDSKDYFQPLLQACRPQRRVRLTRPLYVAEAETTIGQFRKFVEATTHKTAAETNGQGGQVFVDGQWKQSNDYHWRNPGTWTSTDEHPVTQIGGYDAIAFCDWLTEQDARTCRLPTEAEWEFAARAGSEAFFSFGDDPLQLPNYGWHTADLALLAADKGFFGRLFPVKQKRPNAFGLYDMQGNVDEFCRNWFTADYSDLPDPAVDPTGPTTGELAVTRGGSAFAVPAWCGVGVRWSHQPNHPQYATGFRVVCEVPLPADKSSGTGAVDVLTLVDVDRDSIRHEGRINGRWQWQDGARKVLKSTGDNALTEFPQELTGDYRLRLRGQKLGVIPQEGLVIGLVIDSVPIAMTVGYEHDGEVTHGFEPPYFTAGERLPSGREFELEIVVRGRNVRAAVDGQTIMDITGNPQNMVGPGDEYWKRRNPTHLCLGCAGNHWRIIAFDYEPLDQTPVADAPAGAALRFDGQSGHVHVPSLSRDDAGPITLEAWVRPEVQEGHKAVALLSGRHPLQINTYNDRLYAFDSRTSFRDIDEDTLPKFTPGQWHHVAAVCDQANIRVFVDGRAQGQFPLQAADVQSPRAFSGLWLGGHPHAQRPKRIEYRYSGQIDEVRVSRGARYQDDFQPPRRMEADTDTLALYHCDEAAGDVLADASGHGHEGRIVGAQWTVVWNPDVPAPAIAPFDAEQAQKHQEAWAAHLGVPVEYTNGIGMQFRLIPPGEFLMGSTAEEIDAALQAAGETEYWKEHIRSEAPQHKVILTSPIYVGAHEVTQTQFQRIMGRNPSHFAETGSGKDAVAGLETTNHPVEMMSWNDAAEFCAKLSQEEKLSPCYSRSGESVTMLEGAGYRLPTEAEWEFACRGGTTTKYWSGDEASLVRAGWFKANSGGRTHAVGELQANPLGLFDIHGNVAEWVQDSWEPDYYGRFSENAAINPNGPTSVGAARVVRAGYWDFDAPHCRASYRLSLDPALHYSHLGFRVALSVDAVRQTIERDQAAKDAALSAYDLFTSPDWEWTRPENFGPVLNGPKAEMHPRLSADGLTMLFVSDRFEGHGATDIYQTVRDDLDSPWQPPTNLGPVINSPVEDTTPSLSSDGLTLVWSSKRSETAGDFDIFLSRRAGMDAPWQPAVSIGPAINTAEQESGTALSADGLTLLFHGVRAGDTKSELWMARRPDVTAPFAAATRMGPPINSDEQELSGFLSADGTILLFDRHVLVDEKPVNRDLWWAGRRTPEAAFDPPRRIDAINDAVEQDAGASLSADGRTLVFWSRRAGGQGGPDLWFSRRVRKRQAAALAPEIDPQRAAIEWVLSVGGTVAGVERKPGADAWKNITAADQITPEFELLNVDLRKCDISVTDLDRLLPAVDLRMLTLIGCPLDAAGLPRLAQLPYLTSLNLVDTRIKSSNFATLARLPCLNSLIVASGQIDDGCEAIARLPHLRSLAIWRHADLTANDLRGLAAMPQLRQLSLQSFKSADPQLIEQLQRQNSLLRINISPATGTALPLGNDPALAYARSLMEQQALFWGYSIRGEESSRQLTAKDLDGPHPLSFTTVEFPTDYAFTPAGLPGMASLAGDVAIVNANNTTAADALAEALAEHRAVTIVDFANSDLTDAGLAQLEQLVGLRYLNVERAKVTPAGIEHFRHYVPNCMVIASGQTFRPQRLPPPGFSLAAGEFDRPVAEWVHSVGGLVGIVSAGRPYQEIPAGQPLPGGDFVLTKADLLGRPVVDDDLRRFDRLPHFTVLILTKTKVTDGGLESLGKLPNLKSVYLGELSLTPSGLRALSRYPTLAKLHVDHADREQLTVIAEMTNLQELRASRGPIGDRDIPLLAKLANLTLVNLQGTQVTQAGVDALRKLLPNCRVKTSFGESGPPPKQTTGNSDVTPDRAVAEWVHVLGGTVGIANDLDKFQVVGPDQPLPDGRLTIVDLLDCRLTDDDPRRLDRLPHLATLILRNTGITDAGLEALGDLPALQQIYLGSLKITPRGLRTLLRYPGLTTLGMSNVDRAQLEVIAQMSNLSELRISGSPIGDADLPVLATLEHLRSLNLEQTQVTQAGVDAFRKLLPNCRVKTSFGEFGPPTKEPAARSMD